MAYGLSDTALSVMGRASPGAGPLSSRPSAALAGVAGAGDGRRPGGTRDLSSTVSLEQRTNAPPETGDVPDASFLS
jgi:hypothetical protein